ncbi:MAG: ROK family protein [Anaerococcus sp.]|nr:ROK family protein [Anaerococcus sp.]
MFGSIELGGTKIRCGIFGDNGKMLDEIRIKTSDPKDDIKEVVGFFKDKDIKSLGVGAFGPIDVDEDSATYGRILQTPKKLWRNFDLLENIKKELNLPIGLSTDVGASGIGEYELGAARGKGSSLYLTIGTGIGGSFINDGRILQTSFHPEMGHIEIAREEDDKVKSLCDFHDSCFEGLCAGPSILERTGISGEDLDKDHEVFDLLARYIAKALMTYSLILRPDIIIIGGGVVNKEGMIEKIRDNFDKINTGYVSLPRSKDYIVFPKLGNEAGLVGGYILAKRAIDKTSL